MADLYGFLTSNLEVVKATIEPVLGIEMDAHESSYRCGDYYLKRLPSGDEFSLQKNRDPVHEEWRYEEYKEMGALLSVSVEDPERLDELSFRLKTINGLHHLQRTTLGKEKRLVVLRIYKSKE